MCKKEIEPLTCTFCECQYRIEGKKKINGELLQLIFFGKELKKIMNIMILRKMKM